MKTEYGIEKIGKQRLKYLFVLNSHFFLLQSALNQETQEDVWSLEVDFLPIIHRCKRSNGAKLGGAGGSGAPAVFLVS